jgi:hypothetical protein
MTVGVRGLIWRRVAGVAGMAVLGSALAGGTAVASAGHGWGRAEAIPGLAALDRGGEALPYSLSCASPGNCAAGGFYTDGAGRIRAFLVTEADGTWGRAEQPPGTGRLGLDTEIDNLSCPAAGQCAASGSYADRNANSGTFVMTEVNGTWSKPIVIMPRSGDMIESLACPSVGNCAAVGDSGEGGVFVVSERGGMWGSGRQLPGLHALNRSGSAQANSVSCASAGNCSVVGYYTGLRHHMQAFLADETGGTWQRAIEVPGSSALNRGGQAMLISVSCASAGNCSAGGYYTDTAEHNQAMVINETNGVWGRAEEVPGSAELNTAGGASITTLSCQPTGDCAAGGSYEDSAGVQALVVTEQDGTWRDAQEVPGTAALNTGRSAEVTEVSCASAGNCSAGGDYVVTNGFNHQVFVVNEVGGTWRTAREVPGTARLNQDNGASFAAISCTQDGSCGAIGVYVGSTGTQGFVVSRN